MTRKGDHIPKEDRGEGTGWKEPGQRRGTQVEGAAPTLDKGGSRADQRKPKPTAPAGGRETARRRKANPTKVGESNVTIVD